MSKKLYLHIGTPKTGTTAIQAFCFANRELLENGGVYYPVEEEVWDRADAALPQAGNVDKIFSPDSILNVKEKTEELYNITNAYDNVIISSEDIWLGHYEVMADIIKGLYELDHTLEIHVIVYLRNQADYFESWYRECVETFVATISYSDMLENLLNGVTIAENDPVLIKRGWYSCDYYKGIVSIHKALRENGRLHIRNYDKIKAAKKDIILDFFEIIGINISDKYERSKHWANPSLDFKMLEVKRIINTHGRAYNWGEINSLFMSDSFRQYLSEEAYI